MVTSQDFKGQGPSDGPPVVFHWRWYYHFPTWPLWALIGLLLLAPRANRTRQVWVIFIPLVLVLLVWRMPLVLFGAPDSSTEYIGFVVVSVAMTWTMVWLLGDRLKSRYRIVTFLQILGLMLSICILSYCIQFEDTDRFSVIASYCGFVLVLLLAMMFNSHFCRKPCTLRRFLVLLFLWNGLTAFLVMLTLCAILIGPSLAFSVSQLHVWQLLASVALSVGMGSLILSGTVYLINLPFLVLAFKNPFYRERFENLFGVKLAYPELLHDNGESSASINQNQQSQGHSP